MSGTPFVRPWKVKEHLDPVDGWHVRDAYGIRVVSQLDEGTAHLIVRAVNNHEELLEAAVAMLIAFGKGVWTGPRAQALDMLMDAINKADGESSNRLENS